MNKGQEKMVEILKSNKVLEALKREFDRSFVIKISEVDNKIRLEFEEQDTGHSVMTVGDVAAFLQTDRASVRRMTRERSQRGAKHPIIDDAELDEDQQAKLEREFAREYHLITREERLDRIAEDIVAHYTGRGVLAKAMVISIDKATAVRMYDKVQKHWKAALTMLGS